MALVNPYKDLDRSLSDMTVNPYVGGDFQDASISGVSIQSLHHEPMSVQRSVVQHSTAIITYIDGTVKTMGSLTGYTLPSQHLPFLELRRDGMVTVVNMHQLKDITFINQGNA